MLVALLGLHVLIAALAPLAARRLGRGVFLLCGLAPLATVVATASRAPDILAGMPHDELVEWVPALGVSAALRLDGFALLMVVLVSGIGTLVFAYSYSYFEHGTGKADLGRFAATLLAFAGSMLGLVLADNLLLLYVFWELTSITSYLLIGFEHDKPEVRKAALQALLVTAAGGLTMLAGFVLLGQAAGTYTLSAILADPPTGAAVTAGVLLAVVGAVTKSAQVPFHFWLPAAMAAPTPVSAYLHSATMVKAGVYLVARLAPTFAVIGGWRPLLVGLGVATMLVGGWRALRQYDLKLLLAYGTVSQLGFMTALVGAGTAATTRAGAALLLAHGAFKGALFLVVGVIDHQAHTRDLRDLSGLGRRMPWLCAVAVVSVASMAGLPPLLGFVAKEAAFASFLEAGLGPLGPLALAGVVAGSVLTFAYSARFLHGAFADKRESSATQAARPAAAFVAPAALLAVFTVVLGLLPGVLSPLVNGAAQALDPAVGVEPLALWHGFNLALGLSVLTVALGAALYAGRGTFEVFQGHTGGFPAAAAAYDATITGLNRGARGATAVLQNGSLPVYLSVVLLTAVVLPSTALLTGARVPAAATLAESPFQVAVGAAVVGIAVAIAFVQRRFAAILLLGGVGYGVALLFVMQGAPDLALTQLLVETLSVVVFVLVLRHLPDEFPQRPRRGTTLWKAAVSVLVGAFVFVFTLIAGGARTAPPIAQAFLDRSLPDAGGQNVVNVIIVDFRGFDTFGEITVLALAAMGIAMLVRSNPAEREDGQ